MTIVLLIGSSVGAIVGLFHAYYVYRKRVAKVPGTLAEHPVWTRIGAAYYALWTLVLWVVAGSYVLVLWTVSAIAYAVSKVARIASTA